ncbi:MAG: metalloregulator ArsR/SmtB family transcription factor [Candidatus Thiodiazotropha endolucinida]|uniref:Helix-turn-helix domain protein n=2 Tax=Candidatus Thiodiazotropha TaxID=1913444 RepID=A0A7Z0VPP1_9GAMM|nr:helix-turn-helix domain-containing protein [Candidatus Thiodiazotropha taylori]MCG8094783.1 helix-turn-helix domain-containing protein [Candidatus Thiodiazotropha endolucinida]MCG8061902.1 helix-turn-helix domain-containing protein [Candidatus Thiodiazotropha taylori]MCW4223542.1 helix-turn-helix domain-containing protein [Candidatus Thiodiazotropha endolucinida]MCW4235387.1 helix-turn-helix domain-containing protein [Candidatus Thiodiazotropha endolucinida]
MSNIRSNDKQLAEMFKALGNPHRLLLFQRLSRCCQPGTRCDLEQAISFSVGQLGEGMQIAPSTLSHHLKALHYAGLIEMERQGKRVNCWIDPGVLDKLSEFFIPQTESENSGERDARFNKQQCT